MPRAFTPHQPPHGQSNQKAECRPDEQMVKGQCTTAYKFSFAQGQPGKHGKWRCCRRDEQGIESDGAKFAAAQFIPPPESGVVKNDRDHQQGDREMRCPTMHARPKSIIYMHIEPQFSRVLSPPRQGCVRFPHNSHRLCPRRWEEFPARLSLGRAWVLRRAQVAEKPWTSRCGR